MNDSSSFFNTMDKSTPPKERAHKACMRCKSRKFKCSGYFQHQTCSKCRESGSTCQPWSAGNATRTYKAEYVEQQITDRQSAIQCLWKICSDYGIHTDLFSGPDYDKLVQLTDLQVRLGITQQDQPIINHTDFTDAQAISQPVTHSRKRRRVTSPSKPELAGQDTGAAMLPSPPTQLEDLTTTTNGGAYVHQPSFDNLMFNYDAASMPQKYPPTRLLPGAFNDGTVDPKAFDLNNISFDILSGTDMSTSDINDYSLPPSAPPTKQPADAGADLDSCDSKVMFQVAAFNTQHDIDNGLL